MRDIVLRNLSKAFPGKRVLENFSAVFPGGEVSCIMGPSGCGKTTLLNILLGLERPDGGSVEALPERVCAVFQEDRLCEDFSALSNVRLVTGKALPDGEIIRCLESFGLAGAVERPVRELSGGMKRRVAIVRAVLAQGELLVLDEPFKGLDEDTRKTVAAQVRRYVKGRTVIMVTHDPEEARLMGGSILRMQTLEE